MKALCTRPEYKPEWWIGVTRGANTVFPQAHRAKLICAACPFRPGCLAEGIRQRESGIWGGERLSDGRVVDFSANATRTRVNA
jgi:hypothetical protein